MLNHVEQILYLLIDILIDASVAFIHIFILFMLKRTVHLTLHPFHILSRCPQCYVISPGFLTHPFVSANQFSGDQRLMQSNLTTTKCQKEDED